MAAVTIVKKLSAKVLVGNVKAKLIPEGQKSIDLFDVIGIASDVKVGQSTYGEYVALIGRFRATALMGEDAGKQYDSGKLFLPNIALDMIRGALKNGQVEFALRIGIKEDDKSTTGYTYTAQPLIAPAENDPFEALAKKAMATLPAPKSAPAAKK